MSYHRPESESSTFQLIDLQLEQLDGNEARKLRSEISSSERLRAQHRAVQDAFRALDAYQIDEPPSDLADRVMGYIDQQTATLPFRQPGANAPATATHDVAAIPVLSLRELIAIAACITLFVGIFVPGYFKAQNIAARSRCQQNLAGIWMGTAAYAEANDGYLPQAKYVKGGSWLRTTTPNVLRVSNTRPMYMLRSGDYVPSTRIFLCPSALEAKRARPMRAKDYKAFNDFVEPLNCTYSYQYMNEPEGRVLEEMHPQMALVADRNPFFVENAASLVTANAEGEKVINSPLHEDGAGQNVIHVTGQARWVTRPTVGAAGDDIYRSGGLMRYVGNETPRSSTDSFLVP